MNYFELFGLPVAPMVDKRFLSRKFFELQKESHPDFFTRDSETEQENALEKSADINKAFQIFQREDKTIEYFLELKGLLIPNEKYQLPPEFLMEMMEINEALAENNAAMVESQVAVYETALGEEIKPILENYDENKTSKADLLKLKAYYYKKKYLNRILDRLAD